jgi:hypothetical protein
MVRAIPLPDVNLFIFFEAAVWNSFCFLASLIRSAAQIDHPPDACCHKQTTMPRELMSGLTYEKKYLKCGLFAEENKKGVTKNPAIKSNICMYICMYVCIYIYPVYGDPAWRDCKLICTRTLIWCKCCCPFLHHPPSTQRTNSPSSSKSRLLPQGNLSSPVSTARLRRDNYLKPVT